MVKLLQKVVFTASVSHSSRLQKLAVIKAVYLYQQSYTKTFSQKLYFKQPSSVANLREKTYCALARFNSVKLSVNIALTQAVQHINVIRRSNLSINYP
jgi:hypothetical protein